MATAFDEIIDRLKRVEIELSKTLVTVINDNKKELEDVARVDGKSRQEGYHTIMYFVAK